MINWTEVEHIAVLLKACFLGGGKLLIAGNGGSAADSQHIAAEFLGRYKLNRPPLPAIALTDVATITAIGNDFGFEHVFSRPLSALAKPGDMFLAISTSGMSKNIQYAVAVANNLHIATIGLTGKSGTFMATYCDFLVEFDGDSAQVQEGYMQFMHAVCEEVEKV